MTHICMIIAGFALAVGAAAQQPKAPEPKAPAGAAVLQGTWVITSINGQSAPEGSPEMTLTFTGDKYQQAVGGAVNERGRIKIDASKKPMAIDLIIAKGSDAGKTQLGIIEVTGDAIRANLDIPGSQQRPADFNMKEGSIMFLGKKKKS